MSLYNEVLAENKIGSGIRREQNHKRMATIANTNKAIIKDLAEYYKKYSDADSLYKKAESEVREIMDFLKADVGRSEITGFPIPNDTAKFDLTLLKSMELSSKLRVGMVNELLRKISNGSVKPNIRKKPVAKITKVASTSTGEANV